MCSRSFFFLVKGDDPAFTSVWSIAQNSLSVQCWPSLVLQIFTRYFVKVIWINLILCMSVLDFRFVLHLNKKVLCSSVQRPPAPLPRPRLPVTWHHAARPRENSAWTAGNATRWRSRPETSDTSAGTAAHQHTCYRFNTISLLFTVVLLCFLVFSSLFSWGLIN